MFPPYTMCDNKNLYYHIFAFLKNGIKNNIKTLPFYINELTDKKLKSIKRSEFYKKNGKIDKGKGNNSLESLEEKNKPFIFCY